MASKTCRSNKEQPAAVDDPDGVIACLRRKVIRLERELEQAHERACYDELTGLPNRSLLQDRLDQAIVQAERHQKQVALLFLDLDGFKRINDRFGHMAGDNLLRQIATRMLCGIRKGDTASRFGGDEFLVLLSEVDGKRSAVDVACKLRERLVQPYVIGGVPIEITVSIGWAVYPSDGYSQTDLLRRADSAMYLAKERGDGGRVYDNRPSVETRGAR